jgi:hypothetical protein
VRCCERNTIDQRSDCPECGEVPREALVSVVYADVVTGSGARLAVTAQRAGADDGFDPTWTRRCPGGCRS